MTPKTIDQLIDKAVEHATKTLVGKPGAEMVPLWHIQFEDREDAVIATPWPNDHVKYAFVGALRESMKQPQFKVINYCFMSEAWKAEEGPGTPRGIQPRDREDKIEIVMINACDRTHGRAKMLEIIRGSDGVVTELRETPSLNNYDNIGGDLVNLLLKEKTDA